MRTPSPVFGPGEALAIEVLAIEALASEPLLIPPPPPPRGEAPE